MDLNLQGRTAVVCAASRGLGRAVASALADEGVRLMLCARDEEALKAVSADLGKKTDVNHWACDLTDNGSRETFIDYTNEKLGSPDLVIHNVGGPKASSVEDTLLGDWQDGYNQLFPAVAHLNSAFLPGMKDRRWGRIIAITSLSVMEPIANLAISNAMRSAVTSMLKTLSDEVASFGITVNCVAPGWIKTDRTDDLLRARIAKSGQSPDQYMAEHLKTIPARRIGRPEEFASAIVYLASEPASYITGSTICVDGGKRRSTY